MSPGVNRAAAHFQRPEGGKLRVDLFAGERPLIAGDDETVGGDQPWDRISTAQPRAEQRVVGRAGCEEHRRRFRRCAASAEVFADQLIIQELAEALAKAAATALVRDTAVPALN